MKNALSLLIVVEIIGQEGRACETYATVNGKLAPTLTLHSHDAYIAANMIQRLKSLVYAVLDLNLNI